MTRKSFKKGIYKPINSQKYIGEGYPEYRSGWEMKFFTILDRNPAVIEWASESVIVPYFSPVDQKYHRYFVDCILAIKTPTGIKKYLIEIKPSKQTKKPTSHGNKKQSTILYENAMFTVNQAKWEAADKWAKTHGMEFLVLTENQLNILGI